MTPSAVTLSGCSSPFGYEPPVHRLEALSIPPDDFSLQVAMRMGCRYGRERPVGSGWTAGGTVFKMWLGSLWASPAPRRTGPHYLPDIGWHEHKATELRPRSRTSTYAGEMPHHLHQPSRRWHPGYRASQ